MSVADARFSSSPHNRGNRSFLIACSCHTLDEVRRAEEDRADFAVFGPLFEKKALPQSTPTGLNALAEASHFRIPILALGGLTLDNAPDCVHAGAEGVAAIRLFQENRIAEVVRHLHR